MEKKKTSHVQVALSKPLGASPRLTTSQGDLVHDKLVEAHVQKETPNPQLESSCHHS